MLHFVCRGGCDLEAIYSSGYTSFASVHNLVVDLPEFARFNLFLYNLGLNNSHVAELCAFQNSLTAIAGGPESSKDQTTRFFAIDFEVVIPVDYCCNAFRGKRGLNVLSLREFFWI